MLIGIDIFDREGKDWGRLTFSVLSVSYSAVWVVVA